MHLVFDVYEAVVNLSYSYARLINGARAVVNTFSIRYVSSECGRHGLRDGEDFGTRYKVL